MGGTLAKRFATVGFAQKQLNFDNTVVTAKSVLGVFPCDALVTERPSEIGVSILFSPVFYSGWGGGIIAQCDTVIPHEGT